MDEAIAVGMVAAAFTAFMLFGAYLGGAEVSLSSDPAAVVGNVTAATAWMTPTSTWSIVFNFIIIALTAVIVLGVIQMVA